MSVCFLFVPPGPESNFVEEEPDEGEEYDKDEAGLSTASSRGPIFDCFLSLMDDNESLVKLPLSVCQFSVRLTHFISRYYHHQVLVLKGFPGGIHITLNLSVVSTDAVFPVVL